MDTKIALTCLVPSTIQIQDIRKKYDTVFERWPPHFNIDCFPFFEQNRHNELFPIIQKVCSKYSSMNISLTNTDMFPASKKKTGTLFATVDEKTGELKKLHDELLQILKIHTDKHFHPHVTLGRFDDQTQMVTIKSQINWSSFEFTLKGIHLIVREYNTHFVSKCFFPFGKNAYELINEPYIAEPPKNIPVTTTIQEQHTDPSKIIFKPNFENDFKVNVSNIGDYYIYKIRSASQIQTVKPKIMNVLVIDNSGSMGNMTRDATFSIGHGMFNLPSDKIDMIAGTIILFSEVANIISTNVCSANEIKQLQFPQQGQTNITAGIETGIKCILAHHDKKQHSVHYILTFLSDGGHNSGPILNTARLNTMHKEIQKRDIQLSIIIVGIINNDTTLGMQVKTSLETVSMNELDSVYYAKTQRDLQDVLQKLTKGCTDSLCTGSPVTLSVSNGEFVENMKSNIKSFVYNNETVIMVKRNDQHVPQLCIDGINIVSNCIEPNTTDVVQIMETMSTKLSQMKIANGTNSIVNQLNILENFINTAEKLFDEIKNKSTTNITSDSIGKMHIKPIERLQMIKKIKQTNLQFHEERNKLKMLKATVDNNSAKQADYLTGINKKYGSKAVLRSDTISVTHQEVLDQLKSIKDKLILAIENDKNRIDKNLTDNHESSILSLNNALEELEEWVSNIDNIKESDFNDIYSLLVCFGFPAYSVKFEHNNAVQMDPFQTNCTYIEPCPIDTSTMMLSNQLNHNMITPSNEKITDGLILINPMCPETSLLLRQTMIYQYLCSATLCRDLYMYNGKMTFSMHAHALVKAIDKYCENKSTAYLELAIRILYSIRKFWGKLCIDGDNIQLFRHWFELLETITQSEKDSCNHPVQLLLMLGAFDLKQLGITINNSDVQTALINLLNEIMARKMKIKMSSFVQNQTDNTKHIAINLMQNLFDIDSTNSPLPNPDIMAEEPTLISVRESCQHWTDVNQNSNILQKFTQDDVPTFINNITISYLQTFHFCMSVQKYLSENNINWDNIVSDMENIGNVCPKISNYLSAEMRKIQNSTIYDYFNVTSDKKIELLANNMFTQAILLHDSQSRFNVTQKSIFDSTTFQDTIIDLRMAVYFDACKVKKEKWLSIIGDVTFEEAFKADENVFSNMLGVHSHGLQKSQFWAMVHAASGNEKKIKIFLSKSNNDATICFEKSAKKLKNQNVKLH